MFTYLSSTPGLLATVLLWVLTLSVWFDLTERRIPNWITVGGLASSLAIRAFLGSEALGSGLGGGGLGLFLGILLFSAGAMGAGDGKMLTAIGSILGFDVFVRCLPLIGAFGGLLALALTIRNGTVIPTLLRFRALLFHFVSFGRIGDRRTLTTPGSVTVPYGVAVAAGAITAWLGWGLTL
jgi:Flp pilus assembly protein protease CpaA